MYVQVSKESGVYVVHPTILICRGFYDTTKVLLQGCFILVLHITKRYCYNYIFGGAFNAYSKTDEFIYLFLQRPAWSLLFLYYAYFKCGGVKVLRFCLVSRSFIKLHFFDFF